MKVYHSLNEIPKITRPVVTIGTFDGVHTGHKTIINRLIHAKQESGGETFIFTFHPHPRMVLHNTDSGIKLLTLTDEKLALLEKAGIDHALVYPFTKEFAQLSAHDYVKHILVEAIGVQKLIIGHDHRFGNKREGDINTLRQYAQQYRFSVEEIPAYEIEQSNVSSTKIRKALNEGDLQTARSYLGYDYFMHGKVVEGHKRGRTIGYPTANIVINDASKLIPKMGVYAVQVMVNSKEYKGMMNIGFNPTVDTEQTVKTEIHIFNFSDNIYNCNLRVEFKCFLREEMKFPSLDALKKQLDTDKEHALSVL